ncbi:polysaccharide pyruvyl transferase family protein [Rhodopirellula bahusiensis]
MAAAVVDRASEFGAKCAVDLTFGGYEDRQRNELLLLLKPYIGGRVGLAQWCLKMMGPERRRAFGAVCQNEVPIVLDASGFAFGDRWGAERAKQLLDDAQRNKAQGGQFILLPQAYGPFTDRKVSESFRSACELSDMVFVRDKKSREYVEPLVDTSKLVLSPDFTNGLKPKPVEHLGLPAEFACIVPNNKMVENQGESAEASYVQYLLKCVRAVRDQGLQPVLLLHEQKKDRRIGELVGSQEKLRMIAPLDAREIKGVIGKSALLIGSRFHSLVSALSQGIPCIGTSWSHKYEELFGDYEHIEYLLGDTSAGEIESHVGRLVAESSQVREKLVRCAADEKEKTVAMWSMVADRLGWKKDEVV